MNKDKYWVFGKGGICLRAKQEFFASVQSVILLLKNKNNKNMWDVSDTSPGKKRFLSCIAQINSEQDWDVMKTGSQE